MASVTTSQRQGVNASMAVKVPCRVASTSNITLSGEQTIDGVAVVTDDRVLVTGQTDASENGIYTCDTGAWSRAKDWNGTYDIVKGTTVRAHSGTSNSGYWIVTTADPITIGTTNVAFTSSGTLGDFSDTTSTANGDAIIGVKRTETNAEATTQHVVNEKRTVIMGVDYGASLSSTNGTDDWATVFANAITDVGIGGTIFVPQGIYTISTELNLLDGQQIVGAGQHSQSLGSPYVPTAGDGTHLKYTGASGYLFDCNDKVGVRIKNMGITAPSTSDAAIRFYSSEFCTLENAVIRNVPTGDGILITESSFFCTVKDTLFRTSIVNAIHLDGANPNSNFVQNVEISGSSIDVGIRIESGNMNIFDGVIVEPVSDTAHIKMTGDSHAIFRNPRLESTAGTEGFISVDGDSEFILEGNILGGLDSKNMEGAPKNASLDLYKNAFNNKVTDPLFMKSGTYPDGFSLTVGTLSTAERSTTIPGFAVEGYSFHGVSSAAVVTVTFSITDAAILAAQTDRNTTVGCWVYQSAGSGAGIVGRITGASANATNTVNVAQSSKWCYLETAVPHVTATHGALTAIQIQFLLGATGNDVLFYMPSLNLGCNDLVSADRLLTSKKAELAGPIIQSIHTLADDATPSVKDGSVWLTGGTTTITDFDDGVEGQVIEIIAEHAITITDGTNIFLNGSANYVMAATDTLTLRQKADGLWYETARSNNT